MTMDPTQQHINDDVSKDIKELYSHADVANREMAVVVERLTTLETDSRWIKETLSNLAKMFETRFEKADTRLWFIMSSVILGIVVTVATNLLK